MRTNYINQPTARPGAGSCFAQALVLIAKDWSPSGRTTE